MQAKTFQNLRSSRETELFKLTGGNIKAVCEWIWNSPEVAMMHYAQITEGDTQEAAKMTILNAVEKEVHYPVHTGADSPCTESHENKIKSNVTPCNCKTIRHKNTGVRDYAKSTQMGRAGFEPAKALANGFTARPLQPLGHRPKYRHTLQATGQYCKAIKDKIYYFVNDSQISWA